MSATNFDVEALWLLWLDLQAQADTALQEGTAHYFKCIRQTACDALVLEALTSTRLGQNDERVFNHLVSLMETYREVINLFGFMMKDSSPDLVAGLCDVLGSRLRQFEDDLAGQGNPVAREKYALLEKAILNTVSHVDDLEKSYLSDFAQPKSSPIANLRNDLLAGNLATAWESLRESIAEKIFPSLQPHYTQTLQACIASIDDLHTRKTAAYYTDLLEREWEVLGLIIQVQVKAIEAAFEASNDYAEYDMHPILSKLREAYQQTGPIVGGLRRMMQATNSPRKALDSTHEDFAKTITASITMPTFTDVNNEAFLAALLPKADGIFENIRTNNLEQIYDLQQEAKNDIVLANKVIAVFEEARAGLTLLKEQEDTIQNKPEPDESANIAEISLSEKTAEACFAQESDDTTRVHTKESCSIETAISLTEAESTTCPPVQELSAQTSHNIDNEILSGIAETLDIKVESLAESLQQFTENSTKLLAALPTGLPTLSEENLLAAASQLLAAWCEEPTLEIPLIHSKVPTFAIPLEQCEKQIEDVTEVPQAPEAIANFLASASSLEVFATYSSQLAKHILNASTKIEKASFRFKKETLLYEISTFEEILYHSVSRLRESPMPCIAVAVNMLDETFAKLETLLTEYSIAVIRPAAHEPFNGREHEVLIAEETEGFAKGEIVKVMTSGYKYKDQVILRANVIAAR